MGGARFSLTTTVETPLDAHRHILDKTVDDARDLGIIKDMTDLKFGNKALLSAKATQKYLDASFKPHDDSTKHNKFLKKKGLPSPCILSMPKWKSNKFDAEKGLKWRDVISFSKHVFRPYAKHIGRCTSQCTSQSACSGVV